MSQLEIVRHVEAPAARVWAALADFEGIHRFHPLIERADLLTPQACGLGAERTCHMYGGKDFVKERIVEWEEGRALAVSVLDSTMPVDDAWVRLQVEPVGDGSRVTFEMRYRPRYGLAGRLLDALLLRRMLRRLGRDLLVGLEQHLRTGATIGEGGVLVPVPASPGPALTSR